MRAARIVLALGSMAVAAFRDPVVTAQAGFRHPCRLTGCLSNGGDASRAESKSSNFDFGVSSLYVHLAYFKQILLVASGIL